MRPMYRQACSALAVLAWMAAPAAAQEPKSTDAISREIEAHIEQHIELATRQIEHLVAHHLDDIIDEVHRAIDKHAGKIEIKVQNKVAVLAQRQAGEAARREAQRAREAERRRREETRRGAEYTDKISKTLRLGKNGTFDLQNVSGDVVVTGGGGNDVRIEAIKRVRHPNESEARALLQAIDVRIEERNGNVEVRTDYPRRNWSGGVDFTVSLPRDANVVLRSVSGDLRVSSLNGDLRADTISGDLVATSVKRIRLAKTISGDLEITATDGDEVTAQTISGTLMARGIKARSVDLQSVSGDVRIADVESDRTFVRSISGSIDFSGQLARNGRYEFQSHSGDVRVTPLGSPGFSIEATTFSGDLRSDYPLTLQGNPPNGRQNFRGPNRRALRATFGDGGAVLTLQSFSGNITVVKR
jgi:Putative adhesin